MDRDEAALLLIVLISGGLVWLVGAMSPVSLEDDERSAWRALWLPAIPASLPFFALVGFAAAEPEGPQGLGVSRLIAAVPFVIVWLRAAVRASRALLARPTGAAVTTGVFRPRVSLSPELSDALEQGERRAVIAHEEAHARHHDPLRIWLAQAFTDLQWPIDRARQRQTAWLRTLELARDDEAIRQPNVDALDLASAIVKAARLSKPPTRGGAHLTDDAAHLQERVERLLERAPNAPPIHRPVSWAPLMACLAIGAFTFGAVVAPRFVAVIAGAP